MNEVALWLGFYFNFDYRILFFKRLKIELKYKRTNSFRVLMFFFKNSHKVFMFFHEFRLKNFFAITSAF